jgi:hypothetical protein
MTPNPRDLELQRNNAHNTHNAASSRATSLVMPNQESSNNDAVLRVSGASSSERTVNHLRYADLNHVGYATLPPSNRRKSHDTRRPNDVSHDHHATSHGHHDMTGIYRHRDAGLPPYRPRVVETFTAVIATLFVLGVVACACVFPYPAVLDRKADTRRWEVSLARWSAERDYPAYQPIARFATRPASDGIQAYVVDAASTRASTFDVVDADAATATAPAPAERRVV